MLFFSNRKFTILTEAVNKVFIVFHVEWFKKNLTLTA